MANLTSGDGGGGGSSSGRGSDESESGRINNADRGYATGEGFQCRTPALINRISLTFSTPEVSIDTESRTKEHKILGNDTVVQHMGRNAEQVTIEGVCTFDEAADLRGLTEEDSCTIISFEWSGQAIVKTVSVDPLLGMDPQTTNWLYEYSMTATEVTPGEPSRKEYTATQTDGSSSNQPGGGSGTPTGNSSGQMEQL